MQQERGEAAAQGIDGVGLYEDASYPARFVVPGRCCHLALSVSLLSFTHPTSPTSSVS